MPYARVGSGFRMPDVSGSLTVGIDVGGTKLLAGIVNEQGEIVKELRRPTPPEGGEQLTAAIADIAKEISVGFQVQAVGISAAGFVSSDRKRMLATPNIADWNNVDLDSTLTQRIGKAVVVENDANAAAWGEAKFGAGRGRNHLMMLTIGTGIGGGVVVNGELYRGAFGIAGEFGHMRVVPGGHPCGCGARGCFEQYASGSALVRHAKQACAENPDLAEDLIARNHGDIELLTGKSVMDAAQAGDALALSIFSTTAKWLGEGISSLCAILDPECVIIGGGVAEAGEIFLAPTRQAIAQSMPFAGAHPHPEVISAQLGNRAGLVGVADLARY